VVALGVLAAGAIAATQPWTQVGQGRRRAAMDAAIRAAVDAPIGNDAIGNAIGNAVGIDLDVRARIQARGFRLLALAPLLGGASVLLLLPEAWIGGRRRDRWPVGARDGIDRLALQPARALYMVLGVLGYLQDSAAGPSKITVTPEGDALRLVSEPMAPTLPGDHQPAQRQMKIDAQALQWLSDDLHWQVQIAAGSVLLGKPVEQ